MMHSDLPRVLIQLDLVTPEQLENAVTCSRNTDHTWLELLVLHGIVDELALVGVLVERAGVPACDLSRLSTVPPSLRALVPADLAVEHRVVPVLLEPEGDLQLAMVDPLDGEAIDELGFFVARNLLRVIAPVTAIGWALRAYYGWDGWAGRPRVISDRWRVAVG
jgi:hypothetical protein